MFTRKFISQEEIINLLLNMSEGYKEPSDNFFYNCNKLNKPFRKLGVITLIEEIDLHSKCAVSCNIPGCNQVFETVFEFESHYNSLHRYLCSTCKKNLPSAHLLDLHVSEIHDSFFAAQAERKPMYSCFLTECTHKSSNTEERKDHCIREHKFPSNFRFDSSASLNIVKEKVNQNIENPWKMEISDESSSKTETEDDKNKPNMNFFSFGHQRVKTFDSSKKGKKKCDRKNKTSSEIDISPIENDQMVTDLLESLPDQKS